MKWMSRLSVQIGLLYTALAGINIAFFSFMIVENQTDLLQNTFRYHARVIVQEVTVDLKNASMTDSSPSQVASKAEELLRPYNIGYGMVFDENGKVAASWNGTARAPDAPAPALLERTAELTGGSSLFKAPYSIELYEADWSADLLLPLGGAASGYFLNVRLKIAAMDDRMAVLGRQITMAVLWGILFHLVFGIFVYRVIFRRLHLLEEASTKMQTGDLSARAIWNGSRADELDDLGKSFNQMAGSIEDKVNTIQSQLSTISRLNDEMQNELDIGKDVQQAFFPDFTAFQEFKPSFVFMPLREVSGDMCNLYRFKEGDVGAFIGDAAGHGVSGALITALVTSSMDAAIGRHKEPQGLLESMNGELCRRLTSTFYATGIYVLIQKGRLLYSGAGHVDCLLYHRRRDEFSRLESQGTPIGLFEDMRYPQLEIPYESGDRLVLLTDGLTEATAGDQEFGMERARELIRSTASMHSDTLSRALENSIRSFRTSDTDDLTLLVMDLP